MINPDSINIGEKLKNAMKKSGFSWKEIASKSDIPEPTLYKLIKSPDIKVSTLLRLSSALDIPMEFFFGVTENDHIKDLRRLLREERAKNFMLTKAIKFTEQQFSKLFSLLMEIEKHEKQDRQAKLNLMEREGGTKEINLSRFYVIYMRMMSASREPKKEEMYLKYAELFLNIVEIRKALKENPLFIPEGMIGIIDDIVENKPVDEFIDIKKIWKSL